jgi:hypothetical protein
MIASWRGGNFEILPAEAGRKRTIHNSYHALLLEAAQAFDEAQKSTPPAEATTEVEWSESTPSAPSRNGEPETSDQKLYDSSRVPGVEFLVATNVKKSGRAASWGLENPDQFADWVNEAVNAMTEIGDKCQWGEVRGIEGKGIHGNVAIMVHKDEAIGVGWERSLAWSHVRDGMKRILARWIS